MQNLLDRFSQKFGGKDVPLDFGGNPRNMSAEVRLLFMFFLLSFLVTCGTLNWFPVSFWAHFNVIKGKN